MYQVTNPSAALRARKRSATGGRSRVGVSSTVLLLGLTSLLTDVSSEMVAAVLPLYLVVANGYSPLAFGLIDGLYHGAAALVRVGAGFMGDRSGRYKEVATTGYGISAACRLALLTAGSSLGAVSAIVIADRTGKGIRTAPRDALISLSTEKEQLGAAFGVHRAMDTAGAMLGPLIAFAILAAAPLAFDSLFMVSLCFALVGVAVIALFVRNPPRTTPAVAAPTLRGASGLLARGPFRTLLIAGGALAIVTASDNFLYLAAQQELGVDARWFPLFFVGTAAVYMLLAVPVGRLADRVGRARTFIGGHVLLGAAYALLLFPVLGVATVPACLALLGAYYAASDGVLSALAAAMLPPELCGTGLGLLSTMTNVCRLAASVAFGAIWTVLGLNAALSIFAAGLVVVLATAAPALRRAEA